MRKFLAALATLVVLTGCSYDPSTPDNPDPAQVSVKPKEVDDRPDGRYVCVKDGDPDLELAYSIADVTKPYVAIDSERVYTVKENFYPRTGMIVVGTDHGEMFIYMDSGGNLYAVNDAARDHTILNTLESAGLDPIDPDSDFYDRADRCTI